ncbi:MAG: PD-(D/E)XK nuclease family protein, partial [Chroococcales cyanobacterium]
ILLIINESIYIIIENKTFTSERKNQIEDYRQKVIKYFKDSGDVEKKLYAIYYKIENESTYNLINIEKNINTACFLRDEIIKTFNFYSGDDILINQYFEHTLNLEAARANFKNVDLRTACFTKAEIIGYYDALDAAFIELKNRRKIKKDIDYNWAYKGGMKCCLYCFYFTNVANFENYGFYIQLESTAFKNKTSNKNLKLVIKLWIDEKSEDYSLQNLKKSFLILKNHFGDSVKPPARFKVGKWCTTAIIENYISLDEFGAVDLEKTAVTVVNYCNELRSLKKKLQDF